MSDETPPPQRHVAGVWCGQVLGLLPDYVEGTLTPEVLAQAEAHIAGCDWCERFGGTYAGVVKAVRAPAAPIPAGVADRLRARLRVLDESD